MGGASRRALSGAPFAFLSVALLAWACGSVDGVSTGERSSAILDGTPAQEQTGVVFVYDVARGSLCSGSLLAPNLVLTARHCLAPMSQTSGLPADAFVCGATTFGASSPPASIEVGDAAMVDNVGLVLGAEIMVPKGDAACDGDLALLVLSASLALPTLTPRLDSPPAAGETFTAVGFGAVNGKGAGVGTRRSRAGLSVRCVGACGAEVSSTGSDWVGDEGLCQADSGGPALDASGLVIGVASRAAPDCTTPVYGDLASWAAFVREGARHAASVGGYAAPGWVTPPATLEPVGGCRLSRGGSRDGRLSSIGWLAWAGLFCLRIARRRSR